LSELGFTGERVVPGLVDENLFNEHLARYRFAARYAGGARVLDAGAGTGYGARELPNAASYVGVDISSEAVTHARQAFGGPQAQFLSAACEALPFADASFDLVLAFEVIEHLERWPQLLSESKRVLRPGGVLFVSTPNKAWYTASRADAGPNPWHVHEFDYAEFATALGSVFPHVHLWTQNHTESIAFVPASCAPGTLDAPADAAPETAHFFLAACSRAPIADTTAWAWLPASGNTLRERLEHISLLESELKKKDDWLGDLHRELEVANSLIANLQQELNSTHAGYQEKITGLEAEAAARLDWVHDLEDQIARGRAEIGRLGAEIVDKDATITERTEWAQSLDREVEQLRAQFQSLNSEFTVRAARRLRLISK